MKKWIILTLGVLTTAASTVKGGPAMPDNSQMPGCPTVQSGIVGADRPLAEGGMNALSDHMIPADTTILGGDMAPQTTIAPSERPLQDDKEGRLVPADRSGAVGGEADPAGTRAVVLQPPTGRNWIFSAEDADTLVIIGGNPQQGIRMPSKQGDTLVGVKNVYLYRDKRESELRLAVGGYYISFEGKPRQPIRIKYGFGFQNVEFGFSLLTTPGYGGYDRGQRDFLDLRVGKSIHFGFRIFDFGFSNRRRSVEFHTGVHLMCDNYVFNDNLTIRRSGEKIVPVPLDRDYKKSKLTTAAFGIPVQVTFLPAKSLRISALVYGDLVCNAHTKYKKPKVKERFSGVNEFQCGVGATLTYRGFGLYAKYGLTRLFRNGTGPDTHALSVGLYFGL